MSFLWVPHLNDQFLKVETLVLCFQIIIGIYKKKSLKAAVIEAATVVTMRALEIGQACPCFSLILSFKLSKIL